MLRLAIYNYQVLKLLLEFLRANQLEWKMGLNVLMTAARKDLTRH